MVRCAITLILAVAACVSSAPPRPSKALLQCAAGPLADTVSPSREAFLREVLFAAPTPRTLRFDDYTPGSYHADKLDLADGLPTEAERCGVRLRALLVVGPVDVLWAFHVVPFLEDGDSLRVNSLLMPHARITGKSTGRVSEQALRELVADLTRSLLVRPGLPVFGDSLRDALARDFSYNLLLVLYEPTGGRRYWHASLWEAMRAENTAAVGEANHIAESINRVLAATTETYGHGVALEGRAQRP